MKSHHFAPIYLQLVILPLLMVGLAIPMLLGHVKPNGFYGVRTAKTMSSPELWYRANRDAGYAMVLSTAVSLALWAALSFVPFQTPFARAGADILLFSAVLLLALFISLLRTKAL